MKRELFVLGIVLVIVYCLLRPKTKNIIIGLSKTPNPEPVVNAVLGSDPLRNV